MKRQEIGTRHVVFTEAFEGWDLNLHIIKGENRNYVIDTGCGSENMQPILAELAGSDKPLVVINTHHHYDHVCGNAVFRDKLIIAHRLCYEIADKEWDGEVKEFGKYIRGDATKCLPNLLFDSELYFADDAIRLLHAPGHTPDSICVYDEVEKILDAADNIGDDMEEILPNLNCDVETYRRTLDVFESLPFTTCVSGHNQVLGREVLDLIRRALEADAR